MEPDVDRALELMALHQARRRSFNERLAAIQDASTPGGLAAFRCECGLIGCEATIKLTGGEYADVRADARHFAVLAAHVVPDAESVVASRRGWVTVETHAPSRAPAAGDASAWAPRQKQASHAVTVVADRSDERTVR